MPGHTDPAPRRQRLQRLPLQRKGCLFNKNVSHEQCLGKHQQYQQNRGQRSSAQRQSDGRHNGVGRSVADDKACCHQHGAAGDNGGKRLVQGLHNGLLDGHVSLQLHVSAGNHNGIVDGSAHLYGRYHQIPQKIHRFSREIGQRKIHPDTALDRKHQQHRQSRRLEGKQQNNHDKQRREHCDDRVIHTEGIAQILVAGGIARQHNVVVGIVPRHSLPNPLKRLIGLLPLRRNGKLQHETAVGVPQKLISGNTDLRVGIRQRFLQLIVQGNVSRLLLIIDKEKHVDQRNLIFVHSVQQRAEIAVIHRIGGIQQIRHLNIHINKLGKLSGRKLLRQQVAVHGLNVGQPHTGIHLFHGLQRPQNLALPLIVSAGNHDGKLIDGSELPVHHGDGKLVFAHLICFQRIHIIHIIGFTGNQRRHDHHRHKDRRDDKTGQHAKSAHRRNLRHKTSVMRIVNSPCKSQKQPGHQEKYGDQTQNDGLRQNDTHIIADPKLHEHHCHHTGHRGQGTG